MHLHLDSGETELCQNSALAGENITVVRSESLGRGRATLRALSEGRTREMGPRVALARGFVD
jgi:hypothetical protein